MFRRDLINAAGSAATTCCIGTQLHDLDSTDRCDDDDDHLGDPIITDFRFDERFVGSNPDDDDCTPANRGVVRVSGRVARIPDDDDLTQVEVNVSFAAVDDDGERQHLMTLQEAIEPPELTQCQDEWNWSLTWFSDAETISELDERATSASVSVHRGDDDD